ncbi:MAG TPA: HEAT repeat domain-containing protein [Polyangiaceae bacterium]|nr:HEAT repeat domain-containing protein [Polyangiaceae bacterium]
MKSFFKKLRAWAVPLLWVVAPQASAAAEDGVVAPAGGGQAMLAAKLLGNGVAYRACAQGPCAPAPADPVVQLPLGVAAGDVALESITIGGGRHAIYAHTPSFAALLAAVPGGAPEAKVIWSGPIGFHKGEPGEQYGDWMEVTEPDEQKNVRVLFGEVREEISICGRRSILSPQVLDPKDLAFKSARVQRLRRDERQRAVGLPAVAGSPSVTPGGQILQGAAASSGIGNPGALTDGDPESTWSENRGGEGAGEFLRMNAPEQVAITSLSIVVRPLTKEVPKGAAPRKLWLATPDALFAVTFSEDPWAHAGTSYDVKFPAPLKTRCLAVVLDESYAKGANPDVNVTLAEVTAHTEFDGKIDPAELAGALAGGQERSRMAAALLARGGEPAYEAVTRVYPELDDAGRVLALEVIDNAPCSRSAPLYVKATEIGRPGEIHHAVDRLTRCQRAAAPALIAAIASGQDKQKIQAAHILSLVAPGLAVETLVPLLPAAKPGLRAEYRAALTKASQSPLAKDATAAKLGDASLPLVASIDFLRAATAQHRGTPEASSAFARLAKADADFRTRYLLLGPAVELAGMGDARAEAYLIQALTGDTDSHVRARAGELSADLPSALEPLSRALADDDARVRDAALGAVVRLTDPGGAKVTQRAWPPALFPAALRLLASEPFTFVRAHAADALVAGPPGEGVDRPLAAALGDPAPIVRARAIEALGRRRAQPYALEIREVLDNEAEVAEVKARAARALGRLCDQGAADRLTELARKAASLQANADAIAIATSAAAALGQLNPPDLGKRLAPLGDKGAPRIALEMLRSAVGTTDRCR